MNKTELIKNLAMEVNITQEKAKIITNAFIGIISEALKVGEDVILPGFGTFYTKIRIARKGRNPQTGEIIDIPETKVVKFRAGKELKTIVKL